MAIGLAANQNNPHLTANQADVGYLAKDVAGGTDTTLTDNEATYAQLEFTGALTGNKAVIVPTEANQLMVYNNTSGSYILTVKTSAGNGIAVRQGYRAFLSCDGTDVIRLTPDLIDSVIDGQLTHNMASDADYTLSTSTDPQEWQYEAIKITDTSSPETLTAGRNVIVPTNTKKYIFINATAQTLTLKTSGGSGIGVATNKAAILWCDGTNVIRLSADQ